MRLSITLVSLALLIAVAAAPPLVAQETIPRCSTVEPMSGKVGTEIVITGENLGKETVAELYLTDGKNDIKIAMTEQTATSIKSKIPPAAHVGVRYRLMILTRGKEPKLIEQPVKVTIE
jgi:hypothetical protein